MNDQDPLAQLRDIYLPDSAGIWPPAPGWWILAFILLAALTFFIVKAVQKKRLNQYRLEAHNILQDAWKAFLNNDDDVKAYLTTLTQTLKRTALNAYPAMEINTLKGPQWLQFLDSSNSSSARQFTEGPGKILLSLPYQNLSDDTPIDRSVLNELHTVCAEWLLKHRSQRDMLKLNNPHTQTTLANSATGGSSHVAT